jgi:hypothetical protein
MMLGCGGRFGTGSREFRSESGEFPSNLSGGPCGPSYPLPHAQASQERARAGATDIREKIL